MEEIEIKILEINRKEVEEKLINLGAKKLFEGEVNSIIFDYKDAFLDKNNSFIRLRKQGEKSFITLKKFIHANDAKVCDEQEVFVSDFDEAKRILLGIGLMQVDSYKKTRLTYKLENTFFEIESLKGKYSYIPTFLEIESKSIEEIYKYVELLGFKKEDCKSWGGDKFIDYYEKRANKRKSS